ncbi:MAG TPA: hypothetical protein VF771_15535, partial [Longimicrobiaceae bacterium]
MRDETVLPLAPVIVADLAASAPAAETPAAPVPPLALAELSHAGQEALLRLSRTLADVAHVLVLEGADGQELLRLSQPGNGGTPVARASVRAADGGE